MLDINLHKLSGCFLRSLVLIVILSGCHGKDADELPLRTDDLAGIAYPDVCEPSTGEMLNPKNLIAHAGGGYQGQTYTNSLEALDSNYAQGFRLFEIDLIETSDHNFVGVHDWKRWYLSNGFSPERTPPTTEEFFKVESRNSLTPIDYPGIQNWLNERPDAILVTDKIEDMEYLSTSTKDMDRLIVEVFSFGKYVEALKMDLKKPMLSIHNTHSLGDDSEILQFVDSWNAQYAAVSLKALESRKNLVKQLIKRKVCIFSYTSNDKAEMDGRHAEGIHGFYTDFYIPENWQSLQ